MQQRIDRLSQKIPFICHALSGKPRSTRLQASIRCEKRASPQKMAVSTTENQFISLQIAIHCISSVYQFTQKVDFSPLPSSRMPSFDLWMRDALDKQAPKVLATAPAMCGSDKELPSERAKNKLCTRTENEGKMVLNMKNLCNLCELLCKCNLSELFR